jgi:hypothetical protein
MLKFQHRVKLDIICNDFEYEVLYKKAYYLHGVIGGANFAGPAPKIQHKRGYSQGTVGSSVQSIMMQ